MTPSPTPADAVPAPLLTVASRPEVDTGQPPQPPPFMATQQGLGETLRLLREAQGLSIAAVSARLKFSVLLLTALEAEDWARLPAGVPLRGLVKNYATLLDADPGMMLELLDAGTPHARRPRKVLVSDTGGASNTPSAGALVGDAPARCHWGWLIAIALLVGVALVYIVSRGGLPDSWQTGDWFK